MSLSVEIANPASGPRDEAERPSGGKAEAGNVADGSIPAAVSQHLCGILREGADLHRCLAARALGRLGGAEAEEALLAALLDTDEDVRGDAAAGLARLAPAGAGGKLLESLLGDPVPEVKLNALDTLVRQRDPAVVPWLRRLLRSRDEEIAWDDTEFLQGGWDDWVDIQVKALEALGGLGIEDAVGDIVDAIDDEFGQNLAAVGFSALARLGEPGIAALAAYLDKGDERRRARAAAILAGSEAAAAAPAVERALCDPSLEVRLATARALAARQPDDHRLAGLLADPEPAVRAEAVCLIGQHHAERLTGLLATEAPVVCLALFELAAKFPDLLPGEEVAEMARVRIAGPDPDLAAAAAVALAAVTPASAGDDLALLLQDKARPIAVRLGALRGLHHLGGGQAVQALGAILADSKRQLRIEALADLADLAGQDDAWPNPAGETLLAALRGGWAGKPPEAEDTPVAEAAAAPADTEPADSAPALEATAENDETPAFPTSTLQSMLGDKAPALPSAGGESVELTQEDLDHLAHAARSPKGKKVMPVLPAVAPEEDVPLLAARVLGNLDRPEVSLELAHTLEEGDGELRLAAADSLALIAERCGALPEEAVDALLGLFGEQERDLRLAAIRALGAVGNEGTARALSGQLRDPDSVLRAEAVRALSRLDATGPAVEALLREDPDSQVRLAAARAVARARGDNAVDLLCDFAFAFEGHHRREAGRLLRTLDPAAASRQFLRALEEPGRRRLWVVAIEALEEINQTDGTPSGQPMSDAIQREGTEVS